MKAKKGFWATDFEANVTVATAFTEAAAAVAIVSLLIQT